jgi:hypothetical protein
MFTLPIKPTSGRLVFRLLPAGYCALTGVLRLPRTFTVLENAGYAAVLDDSGLQIIPEILDQGVPAMTQSYGIEAQLRAKIWPVLTHPQERFLVRFIEGFPGQNIWTVYAALRYQPKALGVAPSDGHWWRDVAKGGLTAIAPVAGQVGLTVSQLLTQLCVWPGPEGILHTMSQHPVKIREAYQTLNVLHAAVGSGKIAEKAYWHIVRSSALLCELAPLSMDQSYIKYLAKLEKMGGFAVDAPPARPRPSGNNRPKPMQQSRLHSRQLKILRIIASSPSTTVATFFGH